MGSAIASDSGASVPSPIALTNVRTSLHGQVRSPTALIENLHCLLGRLPQHATRNDWYMCPRLHRSRPHDGALCSNVSIHYRNEHGRQGRCISFGGVPDRAASWKQPRQSRDLASRRGSAVASGARFYRAFWTRRRSPDWAMAVWVGWPRATWTRWPRSSSSDRLRHPL